MSGSGNAPRRRSSKGKTRIVRPNGAGGTRSGSRAQSAAVRAQEARRKQLLRLLAGAAAIAVVAVAILVGFNVLGGDDNDASDDTVVIPTSLTSNPGAADDGTPDAASGSPTAVANATEGAVEGSPAATTASGTASTHTIGAADAPVTIVEWADYQCPFCGDFARDVQPKLIEEYVNTGQVRFEFRDFAFLGENSGDVDESVDAAEAAWCAGDQDKFWEFHDTLFANQSGENDGAFANARLKEMASGLNLDMAAFENCVDRNTYENAIIASRDDAAGQGINQTPTIFINGEKAVGIKDFDELRDLIEAALNS